MASAAAPPRFAFRTNAYAWAVVAILCTGSVVSMLERQVINLLIGPLKADLGISDTQISILQGFAFAILYAAAALPIGRVIDARSRVAVIVWGCVIFSVATFTCGLATGFAALVVARIFVGIGEATLTPAGMSLLGDYFPPEKLGRAIGLFIGSTYAGSGLALIIIGGVLGWLEGQPDLVLPVIGVARDWQVAFMLAALPGVIFILLMLLVREPPRSAPVGEAVGQVVPLGDTFRFMGTNLRLIVPIFAGIPLLAAANFAMNNWAPEFFMRTYGWSAGTIGPVIGLMVISCGAGGTIVGGVISDWMSARGMRQPGLVVPVIGAALATPFVIAFPLAGDAVTSLWLLAPAMFFGALPFGAGTAGIVNFAPNRMRGQMIAIYMLIATLIGTGGGPFLIGVWTDTVLGDPAQLRMSLSTVVSALFVAGALIIATGLRRADKV